MGLTQHGRTDSEGQVLSCPGCNHRIAENTAEWLGDNVKCPGCHNYLMQQYRAAEDSVRVT